LFRFEKDPTGAAGGFVTFILVASVGESEKVDFLESRYFEVIVQNDRSSERSKTIEIVNSRFLCDF
jgi:hypothetical protein